MAATHSTMLPLGTKAPDFDLPDVTTQKRFSLKSFAGKKGLLVMFICRHCPFVKHVEGELAKLGKEYQAKGIGVVGISSNDAENYPDDTPKSLAEQAKKAGFTFPYLYDETQSAAKAYTAACTPDFFLFDASNKLAYRGQLDDSRPSNGKPVTGKDLRAALDAVLAGRAPAAEQRPSLGCNIKWKEGAEPDYAR